MRRVLPLLLCLSLWLLLLAPAVLAAPASPAMEGRRVALVIGNGAYPAAPLKNPVNDARDMAATLRSLGFEVIARENASLRQMEDALDQFWASLKKGGTGLFFFAGHGLQVRGVNYLVPVDARISVEQDVKSLCLDANRVLGRMENAGNGLNLVILDACRNNPFARSWRSADAGLAKMDAPTGTLIAYATAPDSVAADGAGRNGVYTSHLLRFMRAPGLKVEDALKQVRIAVLNETGRKQTPWESSSLVGDFYFAGPGKGGAEPQQLALAPPPKAAASSPLPAPQQAPVAQPPVVQAQPAAQDDLASRLAGRYAVAPGPDKKPGPLVLAFDLKDGRLVGTPSGGAGSAQPVSVTDLQIEGKTLRFRYNYKLVVFGIASDRHTDFSGELGGDMSAIPFTFDTHDGNVRKGWLVRLPEGK